MEKKSEKHLLSELRKLRKAFYLAQAIPIISLMLAFIFAALANAFIGQSAGVVAFFVVFFVFLIVNAFFQGEYLSIKCPHCNAYFYSILKWPLMGWIVFLFYSKCNRCGLDLHGKNISTYANRT